MNTSVLRGARKGKRSSDGCPSHEQVLSPNRPPLVRWTINEPKPCVISGIRAADLICVSKFPVVNPSKLNIADPNCSMGPWL